MKKFLPFTVFLASLALVAGASAQTVATDPVGAVVLTIKGNSDTIVAVPLTPMPSYSGTVASAAAGGANIFNLNVGGTTGWAANQFAALYYVRMTSGAKNGMFYTITANTTGQLTLDTAGDNLSGILAGDSFKVLKYWTLGTLFPPASGGTALNPLTASADTSPLSRKSLILIPDPNASGISSSAGSTYYFTSANWYSSGANQISNNVVLYPDLPIKIRQPASVSADVAWSVVGAVSLSRLTTPLLTLTTGPQDNPVAMVRPLDLMLSQLGLESAFTASATTSPLARRDQLLVFDNAVTGINKSASKIYYRTAGTWRRVGADAVVADTDLIRAGAGFTIRKFKSADGNSVVWSNNPTY